MIIEIHFDEHYRGIDVEFKKYNGHRDYDKYEITFDTEYDYHGSTTKIIFPRNILRELKYVLEKLEV